MIDHVAIQDGIEGILHLCLRFLAICRLLLQEDGKDESVVVIPPQEFDTLHEEFSTQVAYLVQLMRRVDGINQGFLLRLDFNSYLSNSLLTSLPRNIQSPANRTSSNSPSKR